MMNTKIYKQVHGYATDLLTAAEKEDIPAFTKLYDELKALCYEHEEGEKNHPVQWETLADFTEETEDAIAFYSKAFGCAEDLGDKEFLASISYSWAFLLNDDGQVEAAKDMATQAKEYSEHSTDSRLKEDIEALLNAMI